MLRQGREVEAASVYRCIMSRLSGNKWPGHGEECRECAQVHDEQLPENKKFN
jgi:hypothetical protein